MNDFKEYANRFDLEHFLKFFKSKLLVDKMQSFDPKKDENYILITRIAYHTLCKSADLLNKLNINTRRNAKPIKTKSSSNIFKPLSISDVFNQVYTKKRYTR